MPILAERDSIFSFNSALVERDDMVLEFITGKIKHFYGQPGILVASKVQVRGKGFILVRMNQHGNINSFQITDCDLIHQYDPGPLHEIVCTRWYTELLFSRQAPKDHLSKM